MFGNKELQTKLEELKELNASKDSQIEELNAKLEGFETMKAHNSELQLKLEGALEDNKAFAENLESLKESSAKLEKELNEHKASQENFEEKVSDAALNIVAQVGHEPLAEVDSNISAASGIEDLQARAKKAKSATELYEINSEILNSLNVV